MAYAKAILEYLGIAYHESQSQTSPSGSGKIYRVQVGAFAEKKNAENLATELKSKGYSAYITT